MKRPFTKVAPKPTLHTGVALVLVLWVLVILTVLIVALAQNTRLENAIRVTSGDRTVARWSARAGVYQAIGILKQDMNPTDSMYDNWYDNETECKDIQLFSGSCTVYADRFKLNNQSAYGIVDEASKLNLNTATRESLLMLPDTDEATVSALLDGRNNSKLSTMDKATRDTLNEAKSAAYFPEVTTFFTVREVGLLPAVNRKILYGEDTNANGVLENNENDGDLMQPPDNENGRLDRGLLSYVTVYSYEWNQDGRGRKRININTASLAALVTELELIPPHALWIIQNRGLKFKSIADLLVSDPAKEQPKLQEGEMDEAMELDLTTFRRIADRITVTDEQRIPGRININTAGTVVLHTLPGITEELAANIIDARTALPEGFSSVAELLLVPGITLDHFKNIAPLITVRSNVFTIHSCGRAERTGLKHYIEAVVDRSLPTPIVIYWKENY
jgi:DNA uptake protein ComE-like DNA-binding protein